MSVTNYNNTCKYHIGKLDNVIFLISEEASKDIIIDNGAAYISGITQEPLAINCYNIKVEETDELDERYKFTHSVSFSVNGYLNHLDLDNRFYAIVRDSEGTYWMINPMFPSKVTYTYTLNSTNSFTNFVMATASNHPILRVLDFESTHTRDCGYFHCTLKDLRLNENEYSRASNGLIRYTNDGFKNISFNRNSAVFTETFNGDDISHQIDFSIPFDDYKSSWHYNLLEFQDNLYSAIIGTTCGKYIITGFHHGLQPSFSVSADDDMKMNTIDISMSDLHDNGKFIEYVDDVTLISESGKTYVNTTEFDAWDCVSKNTAKYILRQEVDAFQNPTGLYKCLEGYESRFTFLGDALVGTFTDIVTFNNPSCGGDSCELDTSIPSIIEFTSSSVKRYSLLSDTNWSITNNDQNITISPTTGNAHQAYTITVANSYTANTATTFTINYCNTSRTVNVNVDTTSSCFPAGNHFTITAEGQYVTIPIQCCAKIVNAGVVTRIQITSSSIKVYVPQNTSGGQRDINLEVVWCDDSTSTVVITQSSVYERWVTEGQVCVGNQKCDFQRRYTGTSASDINTRTNETRTTNCVASSECGSSSQRWIDVDGYTYCYNDKLYQVQKEQVSTDGGQTWTDTGNKRLGLELEDIGNTCSGLTYEYRWLLTSETTCVGYNKYNLYIKQRSVSGTSVWEEVIPTTKSYNGNGDVLPHLVESGSTDCGYVPPVTPTYEWRLVSGYICDECSDTQYRWYTVSYDCQGYDKYAHQKKQFSNDGTTWTDVIPEETQDVIAEYNSSDCGYIEPQYRWVRSGYTCVGYDVYENNIRQYSTDSGITWQNVIPEQYSASTLVEHNSESCGYVPTAETQYRWYTIPDSNYCDGYNEYAQQKKQYSNDSGVTWEDMIPSETQNILISGNSTNCGYVPTPPAPSGTKWVAYYDDGIIESASCRQDDIYVNSGEVKSYVVVGTGSSKYKYIRSLTIGDCPLAIANAAFSGFETLSSVRIGSGVTRIWNSAFRGCDALTSVGASGSGAALEIPSGVITLYNQVFAGCESLTSVTIPNTVLYFPDDWGRGPACEMFRGCSALTQVNLPNTITKLGEEMFRGCYSLPSIVIPDSVTEIGHWAFMNCTALTSVTLPNGLLTIDDSFVNCGLTAITIPNTVTTIGGEAFQSCRRLSSVTIPDSVTSLGAWAFLDCSGLTSVTIGSGVTSIGRGAFSGCTSLTSITINATTPPTLPYSTETFADTNNCPIYVPCTSVQAYKNASGWSNYASRIYGIPPCSEPSVIYRWYPSGTTCIGYDKYQNNIRQQSEDSGVTWENVVPNEYSASTLVEHNSESCGYVPTAETQYRWYPSGTTCISYDKWQNNIKQQSTDGGETWENVSPPEYSASTVIEYNSEDCGYVPPTPSSPKWVATYNDGGTITTSSAECDSSSAITSSEVTSKTALTSFEIGDCVTSISGSAFSGCTSLSSLSIGSGVTSIGNSAFKGCSDLTEVTIPSSVTSIGSEAFRYCSGLTSITIPDSVTEINSQTFHYCTSLTSITIGDCVTSIGYEALSKCSSLTSVTIGSGVTSIGKEAFKYCSGLTSVIIPNSVTSIGNSAFYECRRLTSITIPNSVTSISEWAFGSCSGLTNVTIGSGVITIGTSAFQYCSGLTSVTIGSGVTSIGDAAFYGCKSLTSITILSGVTSIGDSAFYGCSSLTSVIVEAITPPSLDEYAFYGSSCLIYVPAESVEVYKSAYRWRDYASRIQPIPST